MLLEFRVQPPVVHALQRHQNYIQYFSVVYFVEVNVYTFLLHHHFLSLRETKLIALFELTIVCIMLLDCVVCKVNKWLVNLLLIQ